MRSMLITQATRRRSAWGRWLAPWLTAIAVPAIATLGILVAPGGGQQAATPMGHPSSSASPVPTPSPTRSPSPTWSPSPSWSPTPSWIPSPTGSPSSSWTPTPSTSPSPTHPSVTPTPGAPNVRFAYDRCVAAVRDRFLGEPDAPGRSLAGKVSRHSTKGWAVVVADGAHAWACNVDDAVSPSKSLPAPRLARVAVSDVAVADNVLGWGGSRAGEVVWAGGPVPGGVTAIRYTFPDGHVEAAAISGGFWAMRYDAPAPFVPEGHPASEARPISVRLSGPAGTRTFQLVWGQDTCNQVSHGC